MYGVKPRQNSDNVLYVREALTNEKMSPEAKLHRLLDVIEDTIGSFNAMMSRHVALILTCIEKLPYGLTDKVPYFGNYRVEVVVMLFGHIVDLHNFELVLRVLKPYETACVIARIGILNFFNPLKCEGSYGMDLSHWDQRMLAKMFILLETHEPGENWVNKQFRWTVDSQPVPGWVITQNWLTEEGLPWRGFLSVSYYSGEGVRKRGCLPLPKFRKSLLYLTLIEEHEIVEEEHRHHSHSGANVIGVSTANYDVGLNAIKLEIDLWQNYLIRETIGNGGDAVTAPRKVKRSPIIGDETQYSAIPIFRDRNSNTADIAQGTEVSLAVLGSGADSGALVNNTTGGASHFIAKLNELREQSANLSAPLASLLNSKSPGDDESESQPKKASRRLSYAGASKLKKSVENVASLNSTVKNIRRLSHSGVAAAPTGKDSTSKHQDHIEEGDERDEPSVRIANPVETARKATLQSLGLDSLLPASDEVHAPRSMAPIADVQRALFRAELPTTEASGEPELHAPKTMAPVHDHHRPLPSTLTQPQSRSPSLASRSPSVASRSPPVSVKATTNDGSKVRHAPSSMPPVIDTHRVPFRNKSYAGGEQPSNSLPAPVQMGNSLRQPSLHVAFQT